VNLRRLANVLAILSIIMMTIACVIMTQAQLGISWGVGASGHYNVYTRAEHPRFFAVCGIAFALLASLLLGTSFYIHSVLLRRR
jgi:hypothetical protein